VTYLVERLAELRRHLDHLRLLRPRASAAALAADLSLHNDVLFSLLMVCQLVIDLAGELSARRGMPFEDYRQAVRNPSGMNLVAPDTVAALERLPGFGTCWCTSTSPWTWNAPWRQWTSSVPSRS
jgi:hypothetical protein